MNRKLRFKIAAAILLWLFLLSPGIAQDEEYSSEYELLSSLDFRLKSTDRRLNESYQKLLRELPESERPAQKKLQKAWLKRRNRYCNLSDDNGSRRKWLQSIAENPAQALCVITFSDLRARELQHQITTRRAERTAAQPAGRRQYPPVNETWGSRLNLSGKVPEGHFQAFYIDTNFPDLVVAQETVDSVAINYIYDKLHGISSRDFGAYWVGRFNFDEPTVRQLALSLGHAKVRLIIDKQLVHEGGGSRELQYTFSSGEHLIEVEYVNNWHTTDFSMSILPVRKKYSQRQISAELTKSAYDGAEILYAGVYESSSKDQKISVRLEPTNVPTVLILSSYGTVKWHIEKIDGIDLKAVIFGSYSPGSDITGDVPDSTSIFQMESRIGSYRKLPSCSCTGGSPHCNKEGLLKTRTKLETTFGLPLYGFSGIYSTESLPVPETLLSDSTLTALKSARDGVHEDRLKCIKKGNPDFEDFFPE